MSKKRASIALIIVLVLAIGMTGMAAPKEDTKGDKSIALNAYQEASYTSAENIYAMLAADGDFRNAYVVNSFEITKGGKITSYGEYDFIKNLTTIAPIQTKNGIQTIDAESGKFYYQGNCDELELPWNVSVTYELDGKKIKADKLAGNSGALKIHMKIMQNQKADQTFYENYMLQITFTLDMNRCSSIQAEGASVAEAGSNKTIVFTVLPDSDADLMLEADVEDFEMTGVSIAAVPFSMAFELPDTSELADGLTQLSEAIQLLDDGVQELSAGMEQLSSNAGALSSGSSSVAIGLNTLRDNSGTLVEASVQIQAALQAINGGLASVDVNNLSKLQELPGALEDLAAVLEEVGTGMSGLPAAYEAVYQGIAQAIAALPKDIVAAEQLVALETAAASNPEAKAAYDILKKDYDAVQGINGMYTQSKAAFDTVNAGLTELALYVTGIQLEVGQIAADLSSAFVGNDLSQAMSTLQYGLGELTNNYAAFHAGLTGYTDGVNALATGYTELNNGLNTYLNGVKAAAEGAMLLESGVCELAVNTENIPEEMQEKIDEFMADYEYDFEPISFMDSRNQNVESVQFVITTENITVQEKDEPEEKEEEEKGIIDKLKELFS